MDDPDESCFITRNNFTSPSSPIVIHGSDSESDSGEQVQVVDLDGENEGFASTRHLEERPNSNQNIPVSSVGTSQIVKDERAADGNRYSTAGTSTDYVNSPKRLDCPGESTSISSDESRAFEGSRLVSSKGKSRMGSDGTRHKKSLRHVRKSSHKKKHHHSHRSTKHRRRSRSTERSDWSAEEGEEEYERGLSRVSSLSPPREKHHRSKEHKRKHHRTKERGLEDESFNGNPHVTENSGETSLGTSHVTENSGETNLGTGHVTVDSGETSYVTGDSGETSRGTSEQLIQEAIDIEEEIRANKREILKSALKKERIELLHRNMHGSSLQGKEGGASGRGVADKHACTDVMLLDELGELNEEIRSKKKQLLSVVKRMEDEQADSDQ